jgi:hypothetical protein
VPCEHVALREQRERDEVAVAESLTGLAGRRGGRGGAGVVALRFALKGDRISR